jgi:hypothetical protein
MNHVFDSILPYFAALDVDETNRIHIHAVVVANDNQLKNLRKVLKSAGGEWANELGKANQLQIKKIGGTPGDITRVSEYLVRNHGRRDMRAIPGRLTAVSNSLAPKHHPDIGPHQESRKQPRKRILISRRGKVSSCPPGSVF